MAMDMNFLSRSIFVFHCCHEKRLPESAGLLNPCAGIAAQVPLSPQRPLAYK
jgi:hypothetical protein